jgi:hypothetical protein
MNNKELTAREPDGWTQRPYGTRNILTKVKNQQKLTPRNLRRLAASRKGNRDKRNYFKSKLECRYFLPIKGCVETWFPPSQSEPRQRNRFCWRKEHSERLEVQKHLLVCVSYTRHIKSKIIFEEIDILKETPSFQKGQAKHLLRNLYLFI